MSADASTRLLQLDGLLESKNRTIRNEAANAFGKFSIYDENVIKILKKHLTSQSWDARVAAGKALFAILQNIQDFEISKNNQKSEILERLKVLDVERVLNMYKPLLGDAENVIENSKSIVNSRKQREIIDQHLELNSLTGITSTKFLTDDELTPSTSSSQQESSGQELSQVIDVKKEQQDYQELEKENVQERCEKFWEILQSFVDLVTDNRWYARHGAAIAVCQIVQSSFHRLSPTLIDSCLYLFIHVLVLDKFNDFISGRNATAPVREQCAQAVVHLLRNIDTERKNVVLSRIVQMMNSDGESNWNVRQSGLLVMKYYFAVATSNEKNEKETFVQCFELVIQSLNDGVDDVIGCAVKTLSSILANQHIPKDQMVILVDRVMVHVWRLIEIESGKEQLRGGLDALVIDLIDIVQLWLNWKGDSRISRSNFLIITSMIDVLFPPRCEKIVKLIVTDMTRDIEKKLTSEDVFKIIKQFYRLLLFTPPAESLSFLETVFLVFQKMFEIYKDELFEVLVQKIGIWTGCLLYDHRNPMINVYEHCVDGISSVPESPLERMCSEEMRFLSEKEKDKTYLTRKILCAKLLATILDELYHSTRKINSIMISLQYMFLPFLQSNSVMHNLGASIVFNEWGAIWRRKFNVQMVNEPPVFIVQYVDGCLKTTKNYDEMSTSVNMLTKDCNEFIEYCSVRGFDKSKYEFSASDSIEEISRMAYQVAKETLKTDKQKESMETRFNLLMRTIESVKMTIKTSAVRINSLLASALFYFNHAPDKLTPQIRPLVETMETEENDTLAAEIFRGSIPLLVCYSWPRTPKPYVKVVTKALDSFSKCSFRIPKQWEGSDVILSLSRLGGGCEEIDEASNEENAPKEVSSESKNAELVFCVLSQFSEPQCPEFYANFNLNDNVDITTFFTRLELHECFWNRVGSRLSDDSSNRIFALLESPDAAHRFAGAKAIGTFFKSQPGDTMSRCYERLVKMAEDISSLPKRLGAIECFLRISTLDAGFLKGLGTILCPIVFRLLTDKSELVREAAGETFRRLIPIVALEDPNIELSDLTDELKAKREEHRNFIVVLGSPSSLPRITVDQIRGLEGAMLREYQIEGITWLRFLRHYGLNGILADDMGLGKTLQTMCAISMALDYENIDRNERCSLIVCPRTLVDHWCLEWKRYFPKREHAVKSVHKSSSAEICVVAYEDLKSNQKISSKVWNYVVLDEGHVMRNTKTQVWRSANSLVCRSRLILSGTPVQNSPADLWALFSWLMPGYLGSEKHFRLLFLKKILKCRSQKASENDLKAGANALNQLHKLILPFVMRRLKCDVLKELPDKNVQDYECELSEDQKDVYRFLVDRCTSDIDDIRNGFGIGALHTLIALRKLVDHPSLVMDTIQKLDAPADILQKALNSKSGKLEALGQLLVECGICQNLEEVDEETQLEQDVQKHRALIFCQWKVSAKLVSRKLASGEFGSRVSHLVLDGDVPACDRIRMVNRFNEDPTIDVLVLTTHIGGVGLNLTGADTVIFLDHDWNPMKDLQAIDRAHRLGQTRKVNVYRLITQGTVEEKVMSLAKFKLNTAQALISDDNSSLHSMQTGELMEMFTLDGDEKKGGKKNGGGAGDGSGSFGGPVTKRVKKSQISTGGMEEFNLAELWDESQYDDFQVSSFLKNS